MPHGGRALELALLRPAPLLQRRALEPPALLRPALALQGRALELALLQPTPPLHFRALELALLRPAQPLEPVLLRLAPPLEGLQELQQALQLLLVGFGQLCFGTFFPVKYTAATLVKFEALSRTGGAEN